MFVIDVRLSNNRYLYYNMLKKLVKPRVLLMFGLGVTEEQVVSALIELRKNEVDVVTFKGV